MDLIALFSDPATWAALITLIILEGALIAAGFGFHVPKGYIYAAMALPGAVEGFNIWQRARRDKRCGELASGETGDVSQADR